MKFGMQLAGLNASNLSSDRFLGIQNGRRYDVTTENNEMAVNLTL